MLELPVDPLPATKTALRRQQQTWEGRIHSQVTLLSQEPSQLCQTHDRHSSRHNLCRSFLSAATVGVQAVFFRPRGGGGRKHRWKTDWREGVIAMEVWVIEEMFEI
jgi:hypothetical protein